MIPGKSESEPPPKLSRRVMKESDQDTTTVDHRLGAALSSPSDVSLLEYHYDSKRIHYSGVLGHVEVILGPDQIRLVLLSLMRSYNMRHNLQK